MTLYKQLFLEATIAFVVALIATESVYIKNERQFLQVQLASHAQDAATSLGMILPAAMAEGDLVRAEVMVGAVFDRGYYQSILVVNPKGEILAVKTLPPIASDVPDWFIKALPIDSPVAESLITKGWRQMGKVIVFSYPNFAYKQLWGTLIETTLSLVFLYLLTLLALHSFLIRILRPLKEIEAVANSLTARDFKQVKAMPAARELRSAVNAINSMSAKLREMIEHEVLQANRLREVANRDVLTGLDNRRGFEKKLKSLLNDDDIVSGVLYLIQIPNFKEFNVSQGYIEGDELLGKLGDVISSNSAEQDVFCARINAATFALAAFNINRDESILLGKSLRTRFTTVTDSYAEQMQLWVDCGGAYFEGKKVTLSTLLAQCDLSLMLSLESGHALNFVQDIVDVDVAIQGSQYWKALIQDSLRTDRLTMLSQSVMSVNDSKLMQIEVVGRLKNSRDELIPAKQFIPMANRHQLTPMIDLAFLRKLIENLQKNSTNKLEVAINLSILSIQNEQFREKLIGLLLENPAIAKRLIFEFTEFGVVQESAVIEQFVLELRKSGAQFAVDNFGLHRTSFDLLQKLKPSYVKLNQSYMHELKTNIDNQLFISSVVKITHSLDIKTIALGVEDAEILEVLQQLGVDGYQGYMAGTLQELV